MKIYKKAIVTLGVIFLAGMMFIGGMVCRPQPQLNNLKEQVKVEQTLDSKKVEIDMEKIALESRILAAKSCIEKIEDSISLNLLTVTGSQLARLDLNPDQSKLGAYFTDSRVDIKLDYHSRYMIETEDIISYVDSGSGALILNLRVDDIIVDGISVDSYSVNENKAVFGKDISKEQLVALIESTSEGVIKGLNEDMNNKYRAMENLKGVLKEMAIKSGVERISFDGGKTVEKLANFNHEVVEATSGNINQLPQRLSNGVKINWDGSNARYGHPDKKMNKVDTIVIHDTLNVGADSKAHKSYVNNDPKAMAAHLYVSSKEVYQTLALDNIGWHSGNSEVNTKSIGIEMCLGTNMEIQDKILENTRLLLLELKKMYPEAKIVFHKEVSGKECPSMIYKQGWIKYSEKELRQKLGI